MIYSAIPLAAVGGVTLFMDERITHLVKYLAESDLLPLFGIAVLNGIVFDRTF